MRFGAHLDRNDTCRRASVVVWKEEGDLVVAVVLTTSSPVKQRHSEKNDMTLTLIQLSPMNDVLNYDRFLGDQFKTLNWIMLSIKLNLYKKLSKMLSKRIKSEQHL